MARIIRHEVFGICPIHGLVNNVKRNTLDTGELANLCPRCAAEGGIRMRADGKPSYVKTVVAYPRKIEVVTRNGFGSTPSACGGKCTSGKRSCDCKCGGRCHGAGKCYCVEGVK